MAENKFFMVGFMGSGKSTIGRLLAARLNIRFLDLDEYIETFHQKSIPDIFRDGGESVFRTFERDALLKILCSPDPIVIATGGGTPCFLDNMERMNQIGTTFYLNFSPKILAERLILVSSNRPLIKGKSMPELQQFIIEKLADRQSFYLQSQIHLIGLDSQEEIIQSIIYYLDHQKSLDILPKN